MARSVITSPIGRAAWAWLTPGKPDTKFDSDGHYKVDLILEPSPETDEFVETLEGLNQAAFDSEKENLLELGTKKAQNQAKKMRLRDTLFAEDEETGNTKLTFKMKAAGERRDGTRWTMQPALFDAAGKPCKVNVGSGSQIRVAFEASPYFMPATKEAGISLKLKAVQVIELVEYGQRDAEGFGFGEVDDGFVAPEIDEDDEEPETPFDEPEEADEDDDDDFDGDF